MILTLQEIVRQALERRDLDITKNTTQRDKAYDFANQRYERIYRLYPWTGTIDSETITIVEGQKEYVLDYKAGEVLNVFDFTSGRDIDEHSLRTYIEQIAALQDVVGNVRDGNVGGYRQIRETTSKESMQIDDTVEVISSNNNDLTPNCVRIVGKSSGIQVAENITLTGTTAATSMNTYDSGEYLQITAGTTDGTEKTVSGILSVRESTTPANVKAQIASVDDATWYQWIAVNPTPKSSPNSVVVYYRKRFRKLVNFNDAPIIDCGNELVQGVYVDLLKNDNQFGQAQAEEVNWKGMIEELYSRTSRKPNLPLKFQPTNDIKQITTYPRASIPWAL